MGIQAKKLSPALTDALAREVALLERTLGNGDVAEPTTLDDWVDLIAAQINHAGIDDIRGDVPALTGRLVRIASLTVMMIQRLDAQQPGEPA